MNTIAILGQPNAPPPTAPSFSSLADPTTIAAVVAIATLLIKTTFLDKQATNKLVNQLIASQSNYIDKIIQGQSAVLERNTVALSQISKSIEEQTDLMRHLLKRIERLEQLAMQSNRPKSPR